MTTALRMFMLEFGAECVPRSVSVLGAPREALWMPAIGALVETRQGLIALDTGFSRRFLDDGDACDRVYRGGPRPRGIGDNPFAVALERVGYSPADVRAAAVSHLHCDHSGGLAQLGSAAVAIQREELEFAHAATLEDGYYAPDYLDPEPRWRELDGDAELADGVVALETPGHTPGHMSFRIDLPESGTWLLAMDAADLTENVRDGVPPGFTVRAEDGERVAVSLARLRAEQERLGARLVPGHDSAFWRAVRHPAGGHR